jgi:hypothetical protein
LGLAFTVSGRASDESAADAVNALEALVESVISAASPGSRRRAWRLERRNEDFCALDFSQRSTGWFSEDGSVMS